MQRLAKQCGLGLVLFILVACSAKNKSVNDAEVDSTNTGKGLSYLGNSPVRINEVAYGNLNFPDHQGDDPSWVELFNSSDTAVNMAGFAFTDSPSEPRRWVFPSLVVPAHGYQVVFMSGKNINVAQPAADSVSMLSAQGWSWADGDRPLSEGPAGHSHVDAYEYPDIFSQQDGNPVVSAALTLGNNADLPATFNWSAAQVFMRLASGSSSVDLSQCNTLVLRGYLEFGRDLTIRLAQDGTETWLGWATTISGTGLPNSEYRIALPQNTMMPDLAHINGVQFESPANYAATLHFTWRSMVAFQAPVLVHAGFKIKKSGTLYLTDSSLNIRDSLTYPEVFPSMSYGYDSAGALGIFTTPSPFGRAIGPAVAAQTSSAKAVQKEGFYATAINVEIKIPAGATVHYTLDGSVPTAQSPISNGVVHIATTTVLRTIAIQPSALASAVNTQTFFIGETFSLPVVSIATDSGFLFDPDSGIYMPGANPGTKMPEWGANFWAPKEVPISVELFEKNGGRGFQQDGGLTIFGNYSRMNPKKSISVNFREQYGNSHLDYPLFPAHPSYTRFKKFGLRSNGGNAETDYIRDALAQNLTEGLGIDYQFNRPVIVFYNGKYFGIHRLIQKADEDYPDTKFGQDPAHIDLLEAFGGPRSGSSAGYDDLMAFLADADLSDPVQMARVKQEVDISEFLNYWASQIYFNNTDWPANNYRVWRSSSPVTPWRWMLFDVDFGFGSPNCPNSGDFNMMPYVTNDAGPDYPNGPRSTLLFRKLLDNPEFHADFINRMAVLLSWQYAPSRVQGFIDSMQAEVAPEQARDLLRWEINEGKWADNQLVINEFAAMRPGLVRGHVRDYFSLGADIGATLTASGGGSVSVNGLVLPVLPFGGTWFQGHGLRLEALAYGGKVFVGWSDGVQAQSRDWIPVAGATLSANFR